MVMSLVRPAIDSVQLVRDVVVERADGVNADFFNSVQDEWCQRVQQYIDSAGLPPIVTRWPAINDKAVSFLTLYNSPQDDSAQGIILRTMRNHGLSICPACGEMGTPNTLDHYLPKSLYPHFCVIPENLFPMCDACQGAKGTKVGDAGTPRYFIHPYFDAFASEQVLCLVIAPPFNVPTFSINILDGLEATTTRLIASHMRELEIESRYVTYFRNEHRRLIRLVSQIRRGNLDVLQNLTLLKSRAEDPSLNSWEHLFYSAVVSNAAMVEYLTNAQLPEFP